MLSDYLQVLMRRDILYAAGVCLIFIGVVLRGFVRGHRRSIALRKQHALLLRKSGDIERATKTEEETSRLEKYLPRYAAGCIVAGLLIVVAAFFR
ncbi:MAG TPA: hypothetical protein VIM71_16040 [Lacunisphaera sp.]